MAGYARNEKVKDRVTGSVSAVHAGPFNAGRPDEFYVLKKLDGREQVAMSSFLDPVARVFAHGDSVEHDYVGGRGTVKGGPFRGACKPWYAVSVEGGRDEVWDAGSMRLVAAPTALNSYTLDGVTYDLTADYRDNEGDVWRFTGDTHPDGMPEVSCSGSSYTRLADAVDKYGPLTRA
ncbi:phiSA1p31-related protein [Streptomyces lycii]|uniref:Uncharacterized protein n=1 Tax=Streptomyces lycii TaxID=2654337 RepID=A0ABQ7FJ35_9ACTN|nr:phiSA1p31-related protein [Streptomyces lycii]KAF4408633.1 hypothetical protein GCU69_13115 [Streptomyces lycii]